MGAGMFLTKSWEPLHQAFNVSTSYMPSASTEVRDAYIHSLQWSRRFIGAKVFTAILRHGIKGYAAMFRRQMALGRRLREGLIAAGWRVVNDTPLPLVCFDVPRSANINVDQVEQRLTSGGEFWISKVAVRGSTVLRACITSFETDENDVDSLVAALNEVLIETPAQAASR
jgi:glutamate/tyrosine decarboxylase-like PLP-dependent enzyme